MRSAALSLLLLVIATVFAPAAQAQSGRLDTSCGAWQKSRKTLNYYLMVAKAEDYLRGSVESIQDKQGIGGDPMKGVTEKDITAWTDKFCGERPEDSMEAAAEAYAKVLVEKMPASARSEPRGGAPAAAGAAGEAGTASPETQSAAKKKSSSSFKIGRTCESWMSGRKGLDYYLMINSAEEYLKGQVSELREARGGARDPMRDITDKDIARRLDQYCPQNPKVPLETALDAYAGELVGGSAPPPPTAEARSAPKAAAGAAARPTGDAPAKGDVAEAGAAGATGAAQTPRKPSAFKLGRTCDSWKSGRKGLDYYLLMNSAEDYLKSEAAALAAERSVTRDPMQGVGSKQVAAWLDQYCAQRGPEPLETALNAYANELVGGSAPQPRTEARPASTTQVPASPASPEVAKPQASAAAPGTATATQGARDSLNLGGGRNCAAWTGGRKGQEYYNLIESSEVQLRNDVRILRETRGLASDPLDTVTRKEIAAFLDGYCAERPKVPLESAVRVYANQLLSNLK